MISVRLAAACVLLAAAARAAATCPPPELLLQGVRSASRVQMEQLGAEATRLVTPLAHVPGRTLGYEVQGVFRVSGRVADALERAFARHDSYACDADTPPAEFQTPESLQIGLLFASSRMAVAAVLHLPEGVVEMQLEGGVHSSAPLSKAGQRRWEHALELLALQTRTSPDEFYEQMLPPLHMAPDSADRSRAPDSAGGPRDRVPDPR